ncbi:MAG: hypothetical protein QNK04_09655 [Myxococcota bacterium]|nr:hypothetical protein [Myxococcota bacterium]
MTARMRRRSLVGLLAVALLGLSVRPVMGVSVRPGDILVSDRLLKAILQVDPVTGDRRIVSSGAVGAGAPFFEPQGIAIEPDGSFVVVETLEQQVVRVDPITGDRSVVTDSKSLIQVGSGPNLGTSFGITVDPGGDLLVASNINTGGLVMRVDPVSGDRTEVTSPTVGGGDILAGIRTLLVEQTGDLAVLQDGSPDAVYRVDVATGNRTLVSAANIMGEGSLFTSPGDFFLALDESFRVSSRQERSLVAVDPLTGDRATVSGCPNVGCQSPIGSGPVLFNWRGVRREADNKIIQVQSDVDGEVLMRIDSGGNRVELSGPLDGSGPFFEAPDWIDIVPPGVLVADPNDGWITVRMIRSLANPISLPGAATITILALERFTLFATFSFPIQVRSRSAEGPVQAAAQSTLPPGFALPSAVQEWTFVTDGAHEVGVEFVLAYDDTLLDGIQEDQLSVWVRPETGPDLVCSPLPGLNTCDQPPVIDAVLNTISLSVDQLPVTLTLGGPASAIPTMTPIALGALGMLLALAAGWRLRRTR